MTGVGMMRDAGVTMTTGVPCSRLAGLWSALADAPGWTHVSAAQEGDAVGVAAGAWLGGGLGAILSQNSGVGNMINPLATLLGPCRIPVLAIVSMRGMPGAGDEPQHATMGVATAGMLSLSGVGCTCVATDELALRESIRNAAATALAERASTAAICDIDWRGAAGASGQPALAGSCAVRHVGSPHDPATLSRREVIATASGIRSRGTAIVATTGKTSRELLEDGDGEWCFYTAGGMGLAASIGLGVSLSTTRPVIVLDGDGAALMRLGSWSAIATHARAPFVHVVIANGTHDSTGGQALAACGVSFAHVAAACGYTTATVMHAASGLASTLAVLQATPGAHLVHVPVVHAPSRGLPRPSQPLHVLAERFRHWAMQDHHASRPA